MARLFDDGQSEYLAAGATPVLAEPFTVAAWIYPDALANWRGTIGLDVGATSSFELLCGTTNINFYCGAQGCTTTAGPNANTWHHVCGVAAADNDRAVFLDGGSKGVSVVNIALANATDVVIGARALIPSLWFFSGRIAEAAIWNINLTDAEAAILGAGYSPLFVRPQNLVAYWPLIRDEDQDRVGGYDLTPFNAPSIAAHPPVIYPAPPIFYPVVEAPTGLSIPVAMQHYRSLRT